MVLAIILALLCACSLWKKRRQLCGWGTHAHRAQSEDDSAGSCYAHPQYSRCSSFHLHAPPLYTEVTSKPDLYPIVFSCNGDAGKNCANYLMVQYFQNYIVQPGTLSTSRTVDSISSSFICTANEANTLIPPPYSRAASPDHSINFQGYTSGIPRSASQQICAMENSNYRQNSVPIIIGLNQNMRLSESDTIFQNHPVNNSVILSQSEQQFNYKNNSCDQFNINLVNENSTNHYTNNNAVYNSCGSIGRISSTMQIPSSTTSDNLRNSLDQCCQMLYHHHNHHQQSKQQKKNHLPCATSFNSEESPINTEMASKFEGLRSYVNSNTGSAISSFLGSPGSPPRATSPTLEVKELLEQIRQLQNDTTQPSLPIQTQFESSFRNSYAGPSSTTATTTAIKRPSTLIQSQSKKTFFNKSNKVLYSPISNNPPTSKPMKSPIGSSSILWGRGRRGFVSRSAPTTPGSLQPNRLGDDSPLLNEHDEENEPNV